MISSVHGDLHFIATGRYFIGTHGELFVMLQHFCNDLQLIIHQFDSLIGTIMYLEQHLKVIITNDFLEQHLKVIITHDFLISKNDNHPHKT